MQTESSGMSLEQIEWFAALDEGNVEKLKDLLAGSLGLLEEKDENQVIISIHLVKKKSLII